LVFLSLFGTLFLLTQYLQAVLGFSTVEAGAVLLPQAATLMVFAPLSNLWVQRFGNKIVVGIGLVVVSISFVLFSTLQPNSSAIHVIGITVVMALGMANVMAPATDSIMGSLPRAKAGVGSAVNDTTRQMGGAIGVAVFGSLMASHFVNSMSDKLGGSVPAEATALIGDSVVQAVGAAAQNPAVQPYAPEIVDAAKESFVEGLHIVGFVAAAIVFIAAVGVALFLPARARPDEPVTADVQVPVEPEPAV
jgi:Na+/melibiose symporter-like transporter